MTNETVTDGQRNFAAAMNDNFTEDRSKNARDIRSRVNDVPVGDMETPKGAAEVWRGGQRVFVTAQTIQPDDLVTVDGVQAPYSTVQGMVDPFSGKQVEQPKEKPKEDMEPKGDVEAVPFMNKERDDAISELGEGFTTEHMDGVAGDIAEMMIAGDGETTEADLHAIADKLGRHHTEVSELAQTAIDKGTEQVRATIGNPGIELIRRARDVDPGVNKEFENLLRLSFKRRDTPAHWRMLVHQSIRALDKQQ